MAGWDNFTAERIASLDCDSGKQQTIFWDGKTPGLGLRITSRGARSYIFEARLDGRTIRMTIGSQGTWPLETQWRKDKDSGDRVEFRRGAREEAQRLKGLVNQGLDPRREKETRLTKSAAIAADQRRKLVTLGDAWPVYMAARKSKWSERHYQDHDRLASAGGSKRKRGEGTRVSGPLASLLTIPLSELDSKRISHWLEREAAARPTSAAQSFRLLRAFIRWAADHADFCSLIPDGAYKSRAVRDAVPKSRAKEGDCLQREQLPLWFGAVRQLPNQIISAYLQGLLITGARREELAALRWQDVDFRWRSLTIRDKVDGRRTIPLTPYLSSLLLALKRVNDGPPVIRNLKRTIPRADDSPANRWTPSIWVFSSKSAAGGRITEPRIAHNEALVAAGLPHVTLHGLRRSFGTLCEWIEVPSGISAQIMGHAPSALAEKHYRRRPIDLLRSWHDKIEAWMLNEADVQFLAQESSPKSVARP